MFRTPRLRKDRSSREIVPILGLGLIAVIALVTL